MTLLDIFLGVLEDAIGFAAFAISSIESTDGHTGTVKLVKEATKVSFHTEATQPMPADSLADASAVCWS